MIREALCSAFCAGLLAVASVGPALACGGASDCTIGEGSYRYRLPENADAAKKLPAVIFLHGWQATAQGVMANGKLRKELDSLGVALVAVQGMNKTWSYPGSPSQWRDEFAFFDALRMDILTRLPLDPERLVVSGFSMGGSMVWNLACRRGADYAAFVPFAGAFWDPIPQDCDDPARRLLHTHGTSDTVVPIEGRPIGNSYRQSNARDSMTALRRASGEVFEQSRCDALMDCQRWDSETHRFEFRTHGGGHVWRPDWLAGMLRDVLALPPAG